MQSMWLKGYPIINVIFSINDRRRRIFEVEIMASIRNRLLGTVIEFLHISTCA